MDRKTLSAAFPVTVPVLMGYLAIGMAFGFMLQAVGYNALWAFFMSVTIYAGSGQYLGVELLSTCAALSTVALMTLLINFRHRFAPINIRFFSKILDGDKFPNSFFIILSNL